jgi:putative ABC transport system permease protein
MSNDLTRAWRAIGRHRALSAPAIATMALTIGACTAIFSLIHAVLLTTLPYDPGGRLAIIWHTQGTAAGVVGISASDYHAYRDSVESLSPLGAMSTRGFNLNGVGGALRVTCARLSSTVLPMLGTPPARGRWFTEAEDRNGASRVVLVSHALWRERFGSDEALIGSTLMLDGEPREVVGVMPPGFAFPPPGVQGLSPADCWMPAAFSPAELALPAFDIVAIGRLKENATIEHAQADASLVAKRIWDSYPPVVQQRVNLRARVVPLADHVTARSRGPLLMFAGAVVLLLMIGCANVASLMLAHFQLREREIVIRAAIGASRANLVRMVLTESVLLALSGGGLGAVAAAGMLRLLIAVAPANLAATRDVTLNFPALLFAAAIAVLAGLIIGVVPAVRASRDMTRTTAAAGRAASGRVASGRVRSGLVVMELAMTVVLLVAAGLLVQTFLRLTHVPPGFRTDGVLTMAVALPTTSYPTAGEATRFVADAVARLQRLPRIISAGASTASPIGPAEVTVVARVDGNAAPTDYKPAAIQMVAGQYFPTLGVELVAGRLLEDTDAARNDSVTVMNEALARQLWPDGAPLDRQIQWLVGQRKLTVVGIVRNVQQSGAAAAAPPQFYVPLGPTAPAPTRLVFSVRTAGDPLGLVADARAALTAADPELPVHAVARAEDLLAASIAPQRFNVFIASTFAVAALAIAAFGLYALVVSMVSGSIREYGVRMALGAGRWRIMRDVLGTGLPLVSFGMVLGLGAAAAVTKLMTHLLFDVTPLDPITFVAVPVILLATTLGALVSPARRAARVDPALCLRAE